jgi:hypothetical protein
MSAPLKERYRDAHAGPKRCLKLSMTDGTQRIFGMEYRPIKDLAVLAPAGLKVIFAPSCLRSLPYQSLRRNLSSFIFFFTNFLSAHLIFHCTSDCYKECAHKEGSSYASSRGH